MADNTGKIQILRQLILSLLRRIRSLVVETNGFSAADYIYGSLVPICKRLRHRNIQREKSGIQDHAKTSLHWLVLCSALWRCCRLTTATAQWTPRNPVTTFQQQPDGVLFAMKTGTLKGAGLLGFHYSRSLLRHVFIFRPSGLCRNKNKLA